MPVPDIVYLKRRSQVWPAPVLGGDTNTPVDWEPTSEVVEDAGYLRIDINGVDVTFYRDVPTQIQDYSMSEPFGPESLTLFFPQINPFEALPVWLGSDSYTSYDDVVVTLVRPDATEDIMWTGFIAAHGDSVEEDSYGLTVECVGSLYQLDLYKAKPPASTPSGVRDISTAIAEHFSTDVHPGLQVGPLQGYPPTDPPTAPTAVPLTGINTNKEGSWEEVLTGYIQDLLAMATFYDGVTGEPRQWTLDYQDGHPVFAPKDMTTISWTVRCGTPGVKHDLDVDRFMAFNTYYGEGFAPDNCRWRNLQFRDAYTTGDPYHDESFFFPVAWAGWVEPVVPDVSTWIVNPTYDADRLRIERHEHHGANIERATVDDYVHTTSLERSMIPQIMGTITLNADPEEGTRFGIHSGQNILFKGYRGSDVLLHINHVSVSVEDGTVELSVDQYGRDFLTWSEIRDRNKENEHPSWKQERRNRNSRSVEDRYPTWDCEAGSGVITNQTVTRGAWHVYRVNVAAGGQIVRTSISLSIASEFAVGIFDSEVTAAELGAIGDPLADLGEGVDYWDQYGDNLVIAWGGSDQPAGYSPGKASDDDPVTGALIDDASWYYESQSPPYLWLAIWVPGVGSCDMAGQLYPGVY